jgi:hypothetical protein
VCQFLNTVALDDGRCVSFATGADSQPRFKLQYANLNVPAIVHSEQQYRKAWGNNV